MFTLVPRQFFNPEDSSRILSEVGIVAADEEVRYVDIPQFDAILIYTVSGKDDSFPEIFFVLRDLQSCSEYNKILCSWKSGRLDLAIAQGKTLLLANSFRAEQFSTAEYYIFLAMKSLQLNPEVSTISFRGSVSADDELSLYRYFKAVRFLENS